MLGLTLASVLLPQPILAAELDDQVTELQRDWEVVRYQTPANERERRFAELAAKAHRVSDHFLDRSEPLIWESTIVSSWADEKGGFGALGLYKRAKVLCEAAIQIDGSKLDGMAYDNLGMLYFKAPRWPLSFGDMAKAKELLQKALALNPQGIEPNAAFGEYLLQTKHPEEALVYLERALQAPIRPGRQIADTGRREEVRAMLERATAH